MVRPVMRFTSGAVDDARATIDLLVGQFEALDSSSDAGIDGSDLDLLLSWKVSHGDGRLDTWSLADVDAFLLEWCPRQVSAPPSWGSLITESTASAFRFLDQQGLLAPTSASAGDLAQRARSLAEECTRRLGDPTYFGMSKTLLSSMDVDFDSELSQDDLTAVMNAFNALPYERRREVTDPFMEPEPAEPLVIGPVMLPSEKEVRESAASAPVLAGFLALNDYFEAPGKPLTKAGNVKLADAGALSEVLGTEALEETYEGHTYRRRSAANMPDLDLWLWWAQRVGALRVVKSRMVAVKAWRERCRKDPVGEGRKALQVLIDYGAVASYRAHMGARGSMVDQAATALLAIPLQTGEPVDFERMVDMVQDLQQRAGVRPRWGVESPEIEKLWVAGEVDVMLRLMERAGVVVQHDVRFERRHGLKDRVGGYFDLTPFGVVAITEQARLEGVEVLTVDAPGEATAADLAALAEQQIMDVGRWWVAVHEWLVGQDEPRRALSELFHEVAPPVLLPALMTGGPEELTEDIAAVLGAAFAADGPDEPLGVIGYFWLEERGLLGSTHISPSAIMRCRFGLLGIAVESAPDAITDYWQASGPPAELIAEVQAISRLMPVYVEVLLEAIGRHFPDKRVAKAARRELFKVRSRLAQGQR